MVKIKNSILSIVFIESLKKRDSKGGVCPDFLKDDAIL